MNFEEVDGILVGLKGRSGDGEVEGVYWDECLKVMGEMLKVRGSDWIV